MTNLPLKKRFLIFCFCFIFSIACSISYNPDDKGDVDFQDETEGLQEETEGLEVSYQVSPGGEAKIWFESLPDLDPVISRIESEGRAVLEWEGIQINGYGPLMEEQSQKLADLMASPYGEVLPIIALESACQINDPFTARQLAALIFPWQAHLKYSPIDRLEEIAYYIEESGCSEYLSQPIPIEDEDTPVLLYSNDVPIPIIFGYFPFDEEGAYELQEISRGESFFNGNVKLLSRLAGYPDHSRLMGIPLDEYGPCKSMCRGACGADCPGTCEKTLLIICEVDQSAQNTGNLLTIERYTCGVHQGCVNHDACYDRCNATHGCDSWAAANCRHGVLAGTCDGDARSAHGLRNCQSWAYGGGPYEYSASFDYTIESVPEPEQCPAIACLQNPGQWLQANQAVILNVYENIFGGRGKMVGNSYEIRQSSPETCDFVTETIEEGQKRRIRTIVPNIDMITFAYINNAIGAREAERAEAGYWMGGEYEIAARQVVWWTRKQGSSELAEKVFIELAPGSDEWAGFVLVDQCIDGGDNLPTGEMFIQYFVNALNDAGCEVTTRK